MNENIEEFSRLLVVFKEKGSADIAEIKIENVTAIQMLAIASYLKWDAETNLTMMRMQALQQQEANKIVVPEPQILRGR